MLLKKPGLARLSSRDSVVHACHTFWRSASVTRQKLSRPKNGGSEITVNLCAPLPLGQYSDLDLVMRGVIDSVHAEQHVARRLVSKPDDADFIFESQALDRIEITRHE